jgi:NAD(P)H-hydrate epimerase
LVPHEIPEYRRSKIKDQRSKIQIKTQKIEKQVEIFAAKCQCIVLLKGEKDIVSDGSKIVEVVGGNAGMTKGGTGDVLAGLIASLYCKNDAWLAATAGSFINKKAGDNLFQSMGLWFNASDLADQIPKTMKSFLLKDTQ